MKILLLSDLHFRGDWLIWAASQRVDLTAISGDLLDGFRQGGLLPQMLALKDWADSFPGPLALSSGNHDGNIEGGHHSGVEVDLSRREASMHLLLQEFWMDALERDGIVSDRRSCLLDLPGGRIVVSTIPFYPGVAGPRFCTELWDEGLRLKASSGSPWLVLHHEPPADTLVGGHSADMSLLYRIREYQPDYVLSGHIHGQPYAGGFADRIGATWCFNPGVPVASRAIKAKTPNCILLDTTQSTATWSATPNVGKTPISITKSLK